ncbi:MAG: alpha-L-rhamnosidase N-terminal domain-containing protein, partial [Rubrivivax sp.]|nr:alpha-L-rhamnosidase N-terminal domain-containing protein [Rubrivivax sp.]
MLRWLGPCALLLTAWETAVALQPAKLRCEYLVDPHAVGTPQPRLSWVVTSTEPNAAQSAYQILAASDLQQLRAGEGNLWDTGRVDDSETLHHVWAGAPLGSRDQVFWTVRVWDRAGRASDWAPPAQFTIGLLEPGDWQAQWIGLGGEPPAGARDHNGYHSDFADSAEAMKWVQIDLGAQRRIDSVRLHPARPYNWSADVPGFLFPLRYRLDASDTPDFAAPRVLVDRTAEDAPNPGAEPVTLTIEPVTARYVRLTATRLRERDAGHFGMALAELELLDGGQNLALGAEVAALDSIETAGWSRDRLTDGETRSHAAEPQPAEPALLLRREFTLSRPVRRAMLYTTARGLYELWLNGRRVGDQVLAPEWTDYQTRIQVQAYDVTALLG